MEDPQSYRKQAERARQLAATNKYPDAQKALLEIAERWDDLAGRVENESADGPA